MSYTKAAREIRAMGFKVSRDEEGEIRLAFDGNESAAYYTTCYIDALATARRMANEPAPECDESAPECDESAPVYASMQDLSAAAFEFSGDKIRAEINVTGSQVDILARLIRVYRRAEHSARRAGFIGVGAISFAESRIATAQRRFVNMGVK